MTELNEVIYEGAKLACEKIGVSLANTNRKKTWMIDSTGNTEKKSRTTGKNDKTKKKRWNMLGKKGKKKKNNT